MHVDIVLYGAARVVIGTHQIGVEFDALTITLGEVLEKIITRYPRARPYLLDESGKLPSYIRVLINDTRPVPDATLAALLHDQDRVALLVAVAGGKSRVEEINTWGAYYKNKPPNENTADKDLTSLLNYR